jgi:hypothetical protein
LKRILLSLIIALSVLSVGFASAETSLTAKATAIQLSKDLTKIYQISEQKQKDELSVFVVFSDPAFQNLMLKASKNTLG